MASTRQTHLSPALWTRQTIQEVLVRTLYASIHSLTASSSTKFARNTDSCSVDSLVISYDLKWLTHLLHCASILCNNAIGTRTNLDGHNHSGRTNFVERSPFVDTTWTRPSVV
ncbi:hypothetical protein MRX96_053815 [Rhipicephalus microplus]